VASMRRRRGVKFLRQSRLRAGHGVDLRAAKNVQAMKSYL
jgi:hypothetical protein